MWRRLSFFLLLALVLAVLPGVPGSREPTAHAGFAALRVDSTGDGDDANLGDTICDDGTGYCTLRAAIQEATATPWADDIEFRILPPGTHTIAPPRPLPPVRSAHVVDARTQPGYGAGAPAIVLDGVGAGPNADGLSIAVSNLLVAGLRIQRFSGHGVHVADANDVVIRDNVIGLDGSGAGAGNGGHGIRIEASAPDGSIQDNVVSANAGHGIFLESIENVVLGNRIGTDASRIADRGNGGDGIRVAASNIVIGSDGPGGTNVIAFNDGDGVNVQTGIRNTIRMNSIAGNGGLGIDLVPEGVTPNDGGNPPDQDGGANELQNFPVLAYASAAAAATVLQGELVSTPSEGFSLDFYASPGCDQLGNGEGARYLGEGAVATNGSGVAAFTLTLPGAVAPGEAITATATRDTTGDTSELSPCLEPNSFSRTFVVHSTADTGDSNAGDNACNDGSGQCTLRAAIQQANASAGMDRIAFDIQPAGPKTISPATALPVVTSPVAIDATTQPGFDAQTGLPVITLDGNLIPDDAWVSSGFAITGGHSVVRGFAIGRFDTLGSHGVVLHTEPGNVVEGNFIGTDASGTAARPNGHGVLVEESDGHVIGGPGVAGRNLISGNNLNGVEIISGMNNRVEGNVIGTNEGMTARLGNGFNGVHLQFGGGNVVGPSPRPGDLVTGPQPSLGNVIAGNTASGVQVFNTTNEVVRGNWIGTTPSGTEGIGNLQHGVVVNRASDNAIGGPDGGDGNVIAFNGLDGVFVTTAGNLAPAAGNSIRRNSIFGHAGIADLGIDLEASGVTANDLGPPPDQDGGANGLQNFPELTSAETVPGVITVDARLRSTPNEPVDVDYYASPACHESGFGEGRAYLGSTRVTPGSAGEVRFARSFAADVPPGHSVTATATRVNAPRDTSEFSACLVAHRGTFVVNDAGDQADQDLVDPDCEAVGDVCTLRAAIQQANANLGLNRIEFAIGSGPVTITPSNVGLPSANDHVIIDGTTQPGFDQATHAPIVALDGRFTSDGVDGLRLFGQSTVRGLSVHSFGGNGIYAASWSGHRILGNYLGLGLDGDTDLGNGAWGVWVDGSSDTVVGGVQPGEGNVISGNGVGGINVGGAGSTRNQVKGNIVGLSATGSRIRRNDGPGIQLYWTTETLLGGEEPGARNVVSGNGGDGVRIVSARNNMILGNRIGTGVGGLAARGNLGHGIQIDGSVKNLVGGASPAARNVVSGNGGSGVWMGTAALASSPGGVQGGPTSVANLVRGNYIGLDAAGASSLGNAQHGVELDSTGGSSASLNVIGGSDPGASNVISGNDGWGVRIGSGSERNVLQGNVIGLEGNGLSPAGNDLGGVLVDARRTLVGGSAPAEGNVVSGNGGPGIRVDAGGEQAVIQSNRIGTDLAGAVARPNASHGVLVDLAVGVVVGGGSPGDDGSQTGGGNVISGNQGHGVWLRSDSDAGGTVQGNRIGTTADGTGALGNAGAGVRIETAFASVGGELPGQPNVIAHNLGDGIAVASGGANTLSRNSIHSNGELGIDLGDDGVTPNDPGDGDGGPNAGQNFPVLTSAIASGASLTITGTIEGQPDVGVFMELFANRSCDGSDHGEGETFLGEAFAPGAPDGRMTFAATVPGPLPVGTPITATATSPTGSTSEFSLCVAVGVAGGSSVSGDFDADGFDDLAVGVPGEDLQGGVDAGAVQVIYGDAPGLSAEGNQLWHQDRPNAEDFAEPGDRFGSALAAGDFDDDGFDDLAVGVPGEDVGGLEDSGEVQVLYGSDGGLTAARDEVWHQNSAGIGETAEPLDRFGSALAAVNLGNGTQLDLAVGVPGESVGAVAGAGAVHAIYGTSSGLSATGSQVWHQNSTRVADTAEEGDGFGSALAGGNLGGTVHGDLAIGAPGEPVAGEPGAGLVHVLYGTTTGASATGSQVWHQDLTGIADTAEEGDGFGSALAVANLGRTPERELAVGVPGEDLSEEVDAGAVHVLYGTTDGLAATGSQLWHQNSAGVGDQAEQGDRFGSALAGANLGRTAHADLAIGIPGETFSGRQGAGAVAILYGAAAGVVSIGSQFRTQDTAQVLESAERADSFGGSLAVGEFGAGSEVDLAVGVPGEQVNVALTAPSGSTPRPGAGLVHTLYGSADGVTVTGNQVWVQGVGGILDSAEPGDRFGSALG